MPNDEVPRQLSPCSGISCSGLAFYRNIAKAQSNYYVVSLRMPYLNRDCLARTVPEIFRDQHPYPWLKIHKTLTEEGFTRLCETMPDLSLFEREEGMRRAYGQAPHDRYSLHYFAVLTLSQP